MQWRRNSWGQGGRVPPWHFSPGNFCWPMGKREGSKNKKENGKEKKENRKREGGKFKMDEGKVTKWGDDPFFFFSFHFSKPLKFVFKVYQNGNFLWGIKHFTPGEYSGKITLPPLENIPLMPLLRGELQTDAKNQTCKILRAPSTYETREYAFKQNN